MSNSFHILLVDDEPFVKEVIEERLRVLPGVTVNSACTNGAEAKEYIRHHQVDLIITDIMMPVVDGLELAAFSREIDPLCDIAIISGYGEFEYARKALKVGVKDYLLKPIQVKVLIELVLKCQAEAQRRKEKQALLLSEHRDLEQQISELVSGGPQNGVWLTQLKRLMPGGGCVVRVTASDERIDSGGSRSSVVKACIHEALPGQQVLCIGENNTELEYLIADRADSALQRPISAGKEYLQRMLGSETDLEVICRLDCAEMLPDYRSELTFGEYKNEVIELACKYMERHLSEPITRDRVAEAVYLTPPYFSSLFKKVTGLTYGDYLTDLRINKAKELLQKKLAIREIASAVGYHNVKYFNRIFKERTGCLPSEYRRTMMKIDDEGQSR